MPPENEREYVLGTTAGEIERLALQHSVWRADAIEAWQRAGFRAAHTVLDLGCGPGFATVDLAEFVAPRGHVIAVDKSERFLAHLRSLLDARQLHSSVAVLQSDVADLQLSETSLDGAWIRWVLAFVAAPDLVIERVARALKPGGSIAIHEYFDYRMWRFFPRDLDFEEFVGTVMSSWRSRGGEPDIGFALPVQLRDLGLEIRHVRTIADVVEPGSPRWQWAMAFAGTAVDRLRALGDVSDSTAERLDRSIRHVERSARLMATPGVIEVIAARPL